MTWDDILASSGMTRRVARCLRSAARIIRCLHVVALILTMSAAGIGLIPLFAQIIGALNHQGEARALAEMSVDTATLHTAQEYNQLLASTPQLIGEQMSQTADAQGDFAFLDDSQYWSALNIDGFGTMATLEIPSIGVHLAIRHGSDERTLQAGAGHLHGSSLPVGGTSTHSVITGHNGSEHDVLFTRLDELQSGDPFYIHVGGLTLAYQVDHTLTVLPEETELLNIVPGMDMVTLLTCTPYGVNSHRLMVTAFRSRMPEEVPYPYQAEGDYRLSALVAVIVSSVFMIITPSVWHVVTRHRRIHGGHIAPDKDRSSKFSHTLRNPRPYTLLKLHHVEKAPLCERDS